MASQSWIEGLKPSNLRNTIHENSLTVSILMVVVLLIALWGIVRGAGWWRSKPPSVSGVYFIDEDSGEISVKPATEVPPLIGSGGKPTVVNVIFYTCTTCADKKPAYYIKRTDAVKAYLEQHRNDPPSKSDRPSPVDLLHMLGSDELIRSPEKGSPWVARRSAPGQEIENHAQQNCKGQSFQICQPG